jgi:hypothetical protein
MGEQFKLGHYPDLGMPGVQTFRPFRCRGMLGVLRRETVSLPGADLAFWGYFYFTKSGGVRVQL